MNNLLHKWIKFPQQSIKYILHLIVSISFLGTTIVPATGNCFIFTSPPFYNNLFF